MSFVLAVLLSSLGLAESSATEPVDLRVVNRIKTEAFTRSAVMDYLHYLADENGPRLGLSPEYRRAARWAVEAFQAAGIDARLESFGEVGRS